MYCALSHQTKCHLDVVTELRSTYKQFLAETMQAIWKEQKKSTMENATLIDRLNLWYINNCI